MVQCFTDIKTPGSPSTVERRLFKLGFLKALDRHTPTWMVAIKIGWLQHVGAICTAGYKKMIGFLFIWGIWLCQSGIMICYAMSPSPQGLSLEITGVECVALLQLPGKWTLHVTMLIYVMNSIEPRNCVIQSSTLIPGYLDPNSVRQMWLALMQTAYCPITNLVFICCFQQLFNL